MLHACATRFDVTRNLKKFLVFGLNLFSSQKILQNFADSLSH